MRSLLVLMLLAAWPAQAGGIASIYSVDELAAWQSRIAHFANGVMRGEIMPVLTQAEQEKLSGVTFAVAGSAPGQEPLGYWRDGSIIHLSAASMHVLGDLLLSYAWLGRNHFMLTTPDDYMRMLAHWHDPQPPPAPRTALGIPATARDDPGTDNLATLLSHDAYLFMILHELGHVLHNDPASEDLTPAASQAAETAADQFALDVMGRIGRVPTGTTVFFELVNAYARPGSASATAQTHPLTLARLRQIAADIGNNARRYARDDTPQTLGEFRSLSGQLQQLADMETDPASRQFVALRGQTIIPADLQPQRRGELIACPQAAQAKRGEKFAGAITLNGVPFDAELIAVQDGPGLTGDYAVAGVFGHMEGTTQDGATQFTWVSGLANGRGVLRRTGNLLTGSTGTGNEITGAPWAMHKIADCPGS